MKKVKIINGTYGHRPEGAKFITPVKAGEVVEVSDTEATRLVGLGVAACIGDTASETILPSVATPLGGEHGGNLPASADTLDIVDGHFTPESLGGLTKTDLTKLAEDLGEDVSKCKTRAEMVTILTALDVSVDDEEEEESPVLNAADPVV